jgi:hypothetical protein
MKIVTANALRDGGVVYFRAPDQWVRDLSKATPLDESALEAALAFAVADGLHIVGPYVVALNAEGGPDARVKVRESIRASGPTITAGNS